MARKGKKPLKVEITLVPLSKEAWEERHKVIVNVLFDIAVRELRAKYARNSSESKEH